MPGLKPWNMNMSVNRLPSKTIQDRDQPFLTAFQGRFENILRWPMFDALWNTLAQTADDGWYIYAVGEKPPENPAGRKQLGHFLSELEVLLRKDHDESYCGIVYVDNVQSPRMIKVFDPNHLGASCGSSGGVVLPGWVISRLQPVSLPEAFAPPANRKRWWQTLFG